MELQWLLKFYKLASLSILAISIQVNARVYKDPF